MNCEPCVIGIVSLSGRFVKKRLQFQPGLFVLPWSTPHGPPTGSEPGSDRTDYCKCSQIVARQYTVTGALPAGSTSQASSNEVWLILSP